MIGMLLEQYLKTISIFLYFALKRIIIMEQLFLDRVLRKEINNDRFEKNDAFGVSLIHIIYYSKNMVMN